MSVELLFEKLVLSGVLLVVTVLCSVAPWMVKSRLGKNFSTVLRYMNTLAGGVVMGALLLHMIPELFHEHASGAHVHGHHHGHHDHHGHDHHDHHHHDHEHHGKKGFFSFLTLTDHYPWGCFAAGVSFLFLFYVDRIFFGVDGCHDGHHHHGHSHGKHQQVDKKSAGDSCGHNHSASSDDCCNNHQGNGHQSKPNSAAKQQIVQLNQSGSTPRIISLQKEPPKPETLAIHEHDLVGGCHMDSITGASSQAQTMVFVFALSLHSFLEGLGAAGQCDWSGLAQFAFSLLGHKLLEAFALGVSVMRAGFSTTRTIAILSFYSFLTPLGILSGMGALRFFSTSSNQTKLIVEVLNGAAVGSFMFVGMIEMIPPEFNSYDPVHSKYKFMVLCGGFLGMAALNAFGHSH